MLRLGDVRSQTLRLKDVRSHETHDNIGAIPCCKAGSRDVEHMATLEPT
jgi:hypothetical protein